MNDSLRQEKTKKYKLSFLNNLKHEITAEYKMKIVTEQETCNTMLTLNKRSLSLN